MADEVTSSVIAMRKWLDNPLSRSMLKFIAKDDDCGNRLSIAIDYYLGKQVDACWKCRLAGRLVKTTMGAGESVFNINDEDVKNALSQPPFKKGMVNVLQGLAKYGVTMPQKIYAPILVVWDCTHACNLKCKHCYQDAQKKLPDELSTEEAERMIDDLSKSGVVALAFSGGEPMMRKDFFELAGYARDKGLYTALATNGTMITKEVAAKLKELDVGYVEISIDGKDAATHDRFRGAPGMFDKSIQGLKCCIDEGIYTCMATTVTKYNLKEIPEIHDLACSMNVPRMITFNFIPTGRGADMFEGDITPEEREDVLTLLFNKNYEGKTEVLSTAPQYARVALKREGASIGHFMTLKDMDSRAQVLTEFIGGCGAGRHYCCIRPNGDINPCVYMPIKVGNIRNDKLLDVWHNSPLLEKLRDRSNLKGHCGTCENKFICGGCRARAYAYFGDLDAPDPGCINNKGYKADKNIQPLPVPPTIKVPT
jgi:radical SAM protein with 4Fe4S-binding SPASM domain